MRPAPLGRRQVVVVHSSDEMYGADRVALRVVEVLGSLPATTVEVWLPCDVPHGSRPLCRELRQAGVPVRHVELPVLRRHRLGPRDVVELAARAHSAAALLRARRPHLVHCATSACLPVAVAARAARVPGVSLHVQEMWRPAEAVLLRAMARPATLRLTVSGAVDRAADLRGSIVVTNAVAASEAPVPPVHPASGPRSLRFVVASRWNAWKGHRTLLRAWALARCPGHLTILGGPAPVGRNVHVPALVDELVPDPSTVTIVGEVADIGQHLRAADVLVLPSDQPEPFGLVAAEAFAHGRPVVASRAGGVVDVVTDGVDGWLYPPGDAGALAAVLAGLTADDVRAAGRRARATYLARYTPQQQTRRLTELFAAELDRVHPVGPPAPSPRSSPGDGPPPASAPASRPSAAPPPPAA